MRTMNFNRPSAKAMMSPLRSCIYAWLLLTVAGCNPPESAGPSAAAETKFDTRNLDAQKASLKKMTEGMSEQEKKDFVDCMTTVALRAHANKPGAPSAEDFMKPLQGMTKAEIEARAKEINGQQSAGQAK
jgi:hypothetical protein